MSGGGEGGGGRATNMVVGFSWKTCKVKKYETTPYVPYLILFSLSKFKRAWAALSRVPFQKFTDSKDK